MNAEIMPMSETESKIEGKGGNTGIQTETKTNAMSALIREEQRVYNRQGPSDFELLLEASNNATKAGIEPLPLDYYTNPKSPGYIERTNRVQHQTREDAMSALVKTHIQHFGTHPIKTNKYR